MKTYLLLDADGVLFDFIGTMKKYFGIELKPNEFANFQWGKNGYPTAEEFYAVVEPQPWMWKLLKCFGTNLDFKILTTSHAELKQKTFKERFGLDLIVIQSFNKENFCLNPISTLIDDNNKYCKAWKEKGGLSYWFDLAEKKPFENFLSWWEL
ncbi:MAG: hypothetical protein LBC64_07510 [Fibromonadaceae bacterium]|jgi:hypothetical protein|nr:hypothetical protein [Fibromonadaceae bacterium]